MDSSTYNELGLGMVLVNWIMRSPHPIMYSLIAYLYFVLHLGPQLMKNRPAFMLNYILLGYNFYQIIYNFWLFWEFIYVLKGVPCITTSCCACQHAASESSRFTVNELGFLYWLSKIIDLLDTVFFVLRKKFNQVTFLHVYHHVVMVLFVWLYFKYSGDKHSIVIGLVNTFVHVVMYSYYLISALGPKYQKLLWWKKYVTWLQLGLRMIYFSSLGSMLLNDVPTYMNCQVQFVTVPVYLIIAALMDCGVSYFVILFFSANAVMFILLFGDFYIKAYKKNSTKLSSKIN